MISDDDDCISEYRSLSSLSSTESSDISSLAENTCGCGMYKHALITLILGFFFPLIWFAGSTVCCKQQHEMDKPSTYYLYIGQSFLLVIFLLFGFIATFSYFGNGSLLTFFMNNTFYSL